jgi:hypothetical protein
MKKQLTFLSFLLVILTSSESYAQVIISNSFEEWEGGKPVGWQGSTTNLGADSITRVNTGAVYGNASVQIQNRTSSHKRFSSNAISVEEGVEYRFKYFVRGKGDIRAGVFDNDLGNQDFGYKYSAYFNVNSSDWVEVNQSIIADTTTANAQFIFSIRNTDAASNHIQIDSVAVTSATVEPVSIYEIQFTADPSGSSPLNGQVVTTGGIITAVKPNPNGGYYLQAGEGAWNGIFVYDPGRSTSAAIGDSVTLTGTVEEYFSATQLSQVNGFNKVSSGNTVPAAFVATTATLGTEAYEGVLVKAMNAEATSPPNNFKVWPADDGSGMLLVDTTLFRYTPVVGRRYNITGVIAYAFSTFRILPRNLSDVEDLVGIDDVTQKFEWSVFPNPSSGFVHLQCRSEKKSEGLIRLMDVSGKLLAQIQVKLLPGVVQSTEISNFLQGAGVYFIQYQSDNISSTSRLLVH